jgi:hypothetical protein
MDPDTFFVLGLVLGVLAIPAVVSAISDGRAPRFATIILLGAGTMVVYAISQKPGGYALEDIPTVFSRVINTLI